MLKIATIIGARPQFIKAAAVSRAIAQKNKTLGEQDRIKEIIIHTGQHYDENMSAIFFDELHIPRPDFNLNIGSGSHGSQTGQMLAGIETILVDEKPDIVLTYGDTNSTMAGAVAAVKLHIPAVHVEAGLRSFNRRMPEEINRIVTDEISSMLFCPTQTAVDNLKAEGISFKDQGIEKIEINTQYAYLSGDVMYDSILYNSKLAREKSSMLTKFGLVPGKYILATIHRAENTDDPKKLKAIFSTFNKIAEEGQKIILPLHPRTSKYLSELNKKSQSFYLHPNLTLIDPVGYLDMINLEQNARAIFTDSGGVQKEAYLMGIPCVTLRPETEWVETVTAGWNILCGSDPVKIEDAWTTLKKFNGSKAPFSEKKRDHLKESASHYGDGHASEKIIDMICRGFYDK